MAPAVVPVKPPAAVIAKPKVQQPAAAPSPAKPPAAAAAPPAPALVAPTQEEIEAENEFYDLDGKEHFNIVFIGHVGAFSNISFGDL